MHEIWRALADPTRREMLRLLKKGDLNAGEIAQSFNMTKPSISHHLNILRRAELVDSEKDGQHVVYTINTSVLEDFMSAISHLIGREEENQ